MKWDSEMLERLRDTNEALETAQDSLDETAECLRDLMAYIASETGDEPTTASAPSDAPRVEDKRSESVRVKNPEGPDSVITVRVTAQDFIALSLCETHDDIEDTLLLTPEEVNALLPMLQKAYNSLGRLRPNDLPF